VNLHFEIYLRVVGACMIPAYNVTYMDTCNEQCTRNLWYFHLFPQFSPFMCLHGQETVNRYLFVPFI